MAPPAWLPPLNSHQDYTIYADIHDFTSLAHARQWDLDNPPRGEPTFLINLFVTVEFHGKQFIHDEVIKGLHFNTLVSIPCMINPQILPAVLERELMNHSWVPFLVDRCKWDVSCFLDERNGPCWEQIEEREELLKRISLFLLHLKDKPENGNQRNNLLVVFELRKDVAVEEDEFGSWLHWYREQMRVGPNFEKSYRYAIKRPRSSTDHVGFYHGGDRRAATEGLKSVVYDGDGEEKSCFICLEGITSGSRVIWLPCLHVYHEGCVLRWLRSSRACPLCRYELPPQD